MSNNSRKIQILNKFLELCQAAYDAWRIHLVLFSGENPRKAELLKSVARESLIHLSGITREHLLLQIAKLHDPAIQLGRNNLAVAYIVGLGGWDAATLQKLKDLESKLDGFAKNRLKDARNRLLSHSDLETILNERILGEFPAGEDVQYFKDLQEFLDVAFKTVCEDPMKFTNYAGEDAAKLASSIAVPSSGVKNNVN